MIDKALATAAKSVIEGALGVHGGERVVLIGDREHAEAIDALARATSDAGAEPISMILEELAPRPHRWLHPRIFAAVERAQASVLMISFRPHELGMRNEIVDVAAAKNLRHAHMVGVGRESMVAGLAVDPRRIERQIIALRERLGPSSEIGVRSAAGTDLVIALSPAYRWLVYGGVVKPGKKDNLPSGELVTTPHDVKGIYVADGTIGDADGLLSRSLADCPLTLRIEQGRVRTIECARDPDFARRVEDAMRSVVHLDRVGLIGFGLNEGITQPFGNVFTDQKVPGVHLSLGETFPARTGALWTSTSWIAFTTASCDANVDQAPVLRNGRFVL